MMGRRRSWLSLFGWVCFGLTKSQPVVPSIATDCLNGTQFEFFSVGATFEEAKEFCEGVGATLARISNRGEHDLVVGLLFNPIQQVEAWIGNYCEQL